MKKIYSILLVFLLTLSIATATFELGVESIKDRIKQGDTAEIKLTITNTESGTNTYTIAKPAKWRLRSDPLSDYFSGMTIMPGQSKTTTIQMTPETDFTFGSHAVDLKVTAVGSGEEKTISPRIFLESGQKIDYVPNVVAKTLISNVGGEIGEVNPQEPVKVVVSLDNKNSLDISELTVKLKSNMINEERATQLAPNEINKKEEFVVEVDKYVPPQEMDLEIILIMDGMEIGKFHREIKFLGVERDFLEEPSTEKKFLVTVDKVIATNIGNVEKTGTVRVETSFLRGIFTKTTPDTETVKEDGVKYYEWEQTLQPGESIELVKRESYVPLAIIIIIIVLLVLGYYLIKPEVIIQKKIVNVSRTEGGVSEVKVLLLIKNISGKDVRNLRVTDVIPNIAVYVKEDLPGTLPPKRIRSYEVTGTNIEWGIPELTKREERMIRYKIRTKLSILGAIKLPNAELSYETTPGKKKMSYSGKGVVQKEE